MVVWREWGTYPLPTGRAVYWVLPRASGKGPVEGDDHDGPAKFYV